MKDAKLLRAIVSGAEKRGIKGRLMFAGGVYRAILTGSGKSGVHFATFPFERGSDLEGWLNDLEVVLAEYAQIVDVAIVHPIRVGLCRFER